MRDRFFSFSLRSDIRVRTYPGGLVADIESSDEPRSRDLSGLAQRVSLSVVQAAIRSGGED